MIGFIAAIAITIVSAVLIGLIIAWNSFQRKTNSRLLKIKKDLEFLNNKINILNVPKKSQSYKPKYIEGSLELSRGSQSASCQAIFTPTKYG